MRAGTTPLASRMAPRLSSAACPRGLLALRLLPVLAMACGDPIGSNSAGPQPGEQGGAAGGPAVVAGGAAGNAGQSAIAGGLGGRAVGGAGAGRGGLGGGGAGAPNAAAGADAAAGISGTGSASAGVGGSAVGGAGGAAGAGVVLTGGAGGGGVGGAAGRAGAGGMSGTAGMAGAGGATSLPNITIWIAGDSTVMTYPANNTDGNNGATLEGWGQELAQFFTSKVTIQNEAIGGRSVAFFMWTVVMNGSTYQCVDDQGTPQFQMSNGNKVDTSQWSRIKSGIKAGDFLLAQFGTNDETHDCPRFVSTADFETDLGFMADTVKAKGATPIFVTPMGHRSFNGTKFNNTLLPYANAMKDEAAKASVEVEDLNLRSGEYYERVGNSYLATNIFDGGTTHFIKAGAVEMASLVAGEIRRNGGPLAGYLK